MRAWWVSGWAGRVGGRGRRGCAGEALRLLDELAEPVDGVLVGASVVVVGATVVVVVVVVVVGMTAVPLK